MGVRQKNLRQRLVCLPGRTPTPERRLELLRRGELRWSARDEGWEVLIPAAAFKNAHSSYFDSRPLRLVLLNLGGLYAELDVYLRRRRPPRLGAPGTSTARLDHPAANQARQAHARIAHRRRHHRLHRAPGA